MEKIGLLEEAIAILGDTSGEWAKNNLDGQLPNVIRYLVQDSMGKSNGTWMDTSIRVLTPKRREDILAHGKEIRGIYSRVLLAIDYIIRNGGKETLYIAKFKGRLKEYMRCLERHGINDSYAEDVRG